MKNLTGLAAFLLALLLTPGFVVADAASDLADGRAALEKVDLDAALPLLTSAAEALPESVEAQLALGECHLRLGNLAEAIAQFQAVLKLSPQHTQATKMVAALTGRKTSFAQQVAAAKVLIEFEQYNQAADAVIQVLRQPLSAEERREAQLLLAESKLWGGSTADALQHSVTAIQNGGNAGPARVIAALALILQKDRNIEQAEAILAKAGALEGVWKSRGEIAGALINLAKKTGHDEASRTLADSLKSIPPGHRYENVRAVASSELMRIVGERQKLGDLDGVLNVLWPMVSDVAEVPTADSVLKPLKVNSGWLLSDDSSSTIRKSIAGHLVNLARAEAVRDGSRASLLGYWIATELSRNDASLLSTNASEIASLSQPSTTRKPGTVLSRADAIQREMILAGAVSMPSKTLVSLMSAQVARYAKAKDLETGLAQFATVADNGVVTLAGPLTRLPPGPAEQTVLALISQNCATLGSAEFQKASKSVVVVDGGGLGRYDIASLLLSARIQARYPADAASNAAAMSIFERLAVAAKWDDAAKAIDIFYSGQPDVDDGWALARLKIRRAIYDEDRLLAARRTLGGGLSNLIKRSSRRVDCDSRRRIGNQPCGGHRPRWRTHLTLHDARPQ